MADDSRIQKFQELLAKDPRDPMLHFGLGNELSKSGRFAETVESFEEAIRVNPNYTAAYRQLGKSLEKLGRKDEARHRLHSRIQRRTAPAQRPARQFGGPRSRFSKRKPAAPFVFPPYQGRA